MAAEIVIVNLFNLSDGTTVLACDVRGDDIYFVGRKASLVLDCEMRQSFVIVGERIMLNKTESCERRALETRDKLNISLEEAQSGRFRLILD